MSNKAYPVQYNHSSRVFSAKTIVATDKIIVDTFKAHRGECVSIEGKLCANDVDVLGKLSVSRDVSIAGNLAVTEDISIAGNLTVTGTLSGGPTAGATISVINSATPSNASPKTTVDINGSLASELLYHVVYIIISGTPSQVYSDQTPPTAAPAFSPALTSVTFTNYKIGKGDIVVHAFYTTANTPSSVLVASVGYMYQDFTFVRPGPYSGPASIPWVGMGWAYSFTTIAGRTNITSAVDAINYINNPLLVLTNGRFAGLTEAYLGVLNDIECYTTPTGANPQDAMVTKWLVDFDSYFTVNMGISSVNSWTINWGDTNNTTQVNGTSFSYTVPGEYYVTIYADKMSAPMSSWYPITSNLIDVLHWGDIGLTQLRIIDSVEMTGFTADDIPATTITNMYQFFKDCTKIQPDVSNWNVSNVTIMDEMFSGTDVANPDVSNWDVSSVQYMNYMFYDAAVANPDVSNWDVSSVLSMYLMFADASVANPDVSNWNVSNVTQMTGMFRNTLMANPDVSNWDVSSVQYMDAMFYSASVANPDVSNWNVSNVINMSGMFDNSDVANPDVSNWDVGNVTNMNFMFQNTQIANPDVSNWNVSKVTLMIQMFSGAQLANPNVTNWNTALLNNTYNMFQNSASANPDISNWIVSGILGGNSYNMFQNATAFTTANYDKALVRFLAWRPTPATTWSVVPPKSTAVGLPARNTLVFTHGWSITDGGTI